MTWLKARSWKREMSRDPGGGEDMTKENRPGEERLRGRVKVTDKRRARPDQPETGTRPASETPATPETPSELDEARAQAAEYLADLQRVKAEYDNYRKRILREQTRAVEFAAEGLTHRLLEVLDEFELALVAAEHEDASDRFVHGVEMVYAKLLEILKGEGLERIDAQGKPFDPELHEALLQGEGSEDGEPYVADVLRPGYRLKGRVIRPAGVKVARR
jgi:molecular chaperone GrpE